MQIKLSSGQWETVGREAVLLGSSPAHTGVQVFRLSHSALVAVLLWFHLCATYGTTGMTTGTWQSHAAQDTTVKRWASPVLTVTVQQVQTKKSTDKGI